MIILQSSSGVNIKLFNLYICKLLNTNVFVSKCLEKSPIFKKPISILLKIFDKIDNHWVKLPGINNNTRVYDI